MNVTFLPFTSPLRRRRTLPGVLEPPFSPGLLSCENAANDQSGSDDAAITRTFTPSHGGAFVGSDRSGSAPAAGSSTIFLLSGPVTESNGLRSRIGWAFVVWPPAVVADGAPFAAIGGVAS